LKCSEARAFLAQIADKSITTGIPSADLDFLTSSDHVLGGYVSRTSKMACDQLTEECQSMEQTLDVTRQRVPQERSQNEQMQQSIQEDEKKIESPFFGLHGKTYKDTMQQKMQTDEELLSKNEVAISADEASISDYIRKKSALDQLVSYGGEYLSLTPAGVVILNELNSRMPRVSDMEFSDFVSEIDTTEAELRGIAQRASIFVGEMKNQIFFSDSSLDSTQ
jgi:hypothetical protein